MFGTGKKFPTPYAAMLNAAFAHTLDFDDTHILGVIHPGVAVVATALAEAEGKPQISFNQALQAIAIGYEAAGSSRSRAWFWWLPKRLP